MGRGTSKNATRVRPRGWRQSEWCDPRTSPCIRGTIRRSTDRGRIRSVSEEADQLAFSRKQPNEESNRFRNRTTSTIYHKKFIMQRIYFCRVAFLAQADSCKSRVKQKSRACCMGLQCRNPLFNHAPSCLAPAACSDLNIVAIRIPGPPNLSSSELIQASLSRSDSTSVNFILNERSKTE